MALAAAARSELAQPRHTPHPHQALRPGSRQFRSRNNQPAPIRLGTSARRILYRAFVAPLAGVAKR